MALRQLRITTPGLVIVNVNGQTLGLIDNLRDGDAGLFAVASDIPVVVLTSRVDDVHRVRILERGADDILVKPFSYAELRARIQAVLRRTKPRQGPAVLRAGPIRIDMRRREVAESGLTLRNELDGLVADYLATAKKLAAVPMSINLA